tara:strand:+ start:1227 stop:1451 length:225 start_codon:yes stop_codon:yes gene_type:complete
LILLLQRRTANDLLEGVGADVLVTPSRLVPNKNVAGPLRVGTDHNSRPIEAQSIDHDDSSADVRCTPADLRLRL